MDIPILYANPLPYVGGRTEIYEKGKPIKMLPENTRVKVIAGHIYLLRAKRNKTDLYVMFRVETLKPSDEVTISWKIVPSPENN